MFVIRKKLYANEGSDPNTRYDETEDCVQRTFDGGASWQCDENSDPRTSPQFLNPASADDRCAGAQGVANFVRDFLEGAYQAFNVIGISSWAIQIGFFFTPITIFWRIAMLVGEGLLEIGELTLQATFDEDTFDQIRDIAYCWVGEDGKFADQAAFDGFGAQLQEDIGGSTFNIVMALMFNLYGWVGFSNAAVKYAEGADCSGAECAWCKRWYLRDGNHDGMTVTLLDGATITPSGLRSGASGGSALLHAIINFAADVPIKNAAISYTTGANANLGTRAWALYVNGSPVRTEVLNTGVVTNAVKESLELNVNVDQFNFGIDNNGTGGVNYLVWVQLEGVGECPFDNCDNCE